MLRLLSNSLWLACLCACGQSFTLSDPTFLGGQSAAVAAASFTPTNMIMWLKADAITGVTNNQQLSFWIDSGPLGQSVTATAYPKYATNQINGLSAVLFNSTNSQYFNVPGRMLTNATAAEIFAVLKANADPPSAALDGGLWTFAGDDNNMPFYPFTDGSIYDGFCSTLRKTVGNPTPALTSWRLYNVSSTNGSWIARLNGTQIFSTAVNTFSGTTNSFNLPVLGKSGSVAYFFNGYIAELILFGRITGDTERTNVQNYIATKYGLTIP